jgi:hypothetical protein
MPLVQRIGEAAAPLLQQLTGSHNRTLHGADHRIDSDGFVHIIPAEAVASDAEQWVAEFARFIDGLGQAVRRDLTFARPAA